MTIDGPAGALTGVMRTGGQLLFGDGMSRQVGRVAAAHGTRAFVRVDPALRALPSWSELLADLDVAGLEVTVFADVVPELPATTVAEALELARAFAPDVFVAVGGGSCIDLAKVTSLLLTHGGSLSDYYGELKVPGPVRPIIAVPTTSGTGSEVTPVAVVSDPNLALKVGVSSPHLIPRAAICDPALTHSCPSSVSAHAGMDALSHALEAYTATRRPDFTGVALDRVYVGKNDLSDAFALVAIGRIAGSIGAACADGNDAQARADMMYGSMMAGLSFGVAGANLVHALQYPIGAATKTPHGLGIAVMLPYVLQYNVAERLEALGRVGLAFGIGDGAPSAENADASIGFVEGLNRTIGLPSSLAELGVERSDLEMMATQTIGVSRLVENNVRSVAKEDAEAILEAAWLGDRQRLAG